MSHPLNQRVSVVASFAAALVADFLVLPGLSLAQNGPAVPDPAAEFVQLKADIEILSWGGGQGGTDDPQPQSFQMDVVVGRDKWVIGHRAFGLTNQYSFDGKRIVERTWLSRVSSTADPHGTNNSGRWWTRTSESPDGNPSETVRVADHLNMVSRIVWLALCSAPTLNHPGHKLYPPDDFWKEYLDPSTFTEQVARFDDDLGLPKSLLIFRGEHQPVVDYRISGTTNASGWLFPQSFYLLEYNPRAAKGCLLGLLAHGKVSSIAPAADPLPVAATSRPSSDHTMRFVSVSPSLVHVEGSSDVYDWSLDATQVVGFLELNQNLFGPASTLALRHQPGDLEARAEFCFPVRHLASGNSEPVFSNKADQSVFIYSLKTTENPNIIYRLHHLIATPASRSENSDLVLQSTGEIVMGGVTHPISFPITIQRSDDVLRLTGATSLNLSDFGIRPPPISGQGWVVNVGDVVQSSFDLQLKKVEPQ